MSDYVPPASLDQFSKCAVAGCDNHCLRILPYAQRCKPHGGPDVPFYSVAPTGEMKVRRESFVARRD